MFIYEEINEGWLQKIKEYNFKKPLDDGLLPETHWYINHENNEALYYIGWVSSAILRGNGEDYYEFAYIYNDECIPVTAYIFPHSKGKWNDKNKINYNNRSIPGLKKQILERNIKEAITFYLENIHYDRKNYKY